MCSLSEETQLLLPSCVRPVEFVTTAAELTRLATQVLANDTVVGLDVEWKPSERLPALLQVATEDRVALVDLLELRRGGGTSTDSARVAALLSDLLTADGIIRLGWHFETDLRMLHAWLPCLREVRNYVEVGEIYEHAVRTVANARSTAKLPHRHNFVSSSANASLADAVRAVLPGPANTLCKDAQLSDWEARPLSTEQTHYAALDAYCLLMLAQNTDCLPEPRTLALPQAKSRKHRKEPHSQSPGAPGKRTASNLRDDHNHVKASLQRREEKRNAFITRFCVRKEVYSNCRILSASGSLVAYCDRSKAEWYVNKGLGRRVGADEPFTIQLAFKPEERSGGHDFEELGSLVPRKNICVVCGNAGNLSRFHIIPKSYQRHFAVGLKAHQCHDIVLLCVDCHEVSNKVYMNFKTILAHEYNAPLKGSGLIEPTREERAVVKAASALLRNVEQVPQTRIDQLRHIVTVWLATKDPPSKVDVHAEHDANPLVGIPTVDLRYAVCLGVDKPRKGSWKAAVSVSSDFRSHGELVLEAVTAQDGDDGLHRFMTRWRDHFVRHMAPKYMPDDWRLEYRVPMRDPSAWVDMPADHVDRGTADAASLGAALAHAALEDYK